MVKPGNRKEFVIGFKNHWFVVTVNNTLYNQRRRNTAHTFFSFLFFLKMTTYTQLMCSKMKQGSFNSMFLIYIRYIYFIAKCIIQYLCNILLKRLELTCKSIPQSSSGEIKMLAYEIDP